MQTLKSWVIAWSLVLLTAQFGFAAGFGIYEWSARGNALGGATVGRADDPSALATNPAGITQLDGLQVLGGFTAIHPVLDIKADGKWYSSDKDSLWIPPHFFATWKVNDRYSIGLGTFSRFGLGSVFDEDWGGRYNSYEAIIESVSINPNVAVKVTDNFSAAFGVEAMYLNFSQKKKLKLGAVDGDAHLDADGMGYGFNMALHYQPCSYAKLGLSYRSPVTMKVTGDANFSDIPAGLPLPAGYFEDTSASGTVTLPDSFAFGVAMYPTEKLSVEVGAVYTLWSKYDELKINFGDATIYKPGNVVLVDQTVTPKNWDDVWRFNIGVEYAALDWLDLRVGYVYDQSPLQDDTIDYMVPANDRHLLNGGLGFHWDSWVVDVNYTYLMIMDRDIDARAADYVREGEIDNADAHMVGLSIGYKF
ncbi:long-chain fatty acid transport protein [Desulfomicrobium norvegicum]|uniref:Long-chain fatty acid transport protein n=1 Tax=Desulfomicrobium norvegicum (strain DSM 1741 / NCIMB 8310) TaxID=52561 RepID=A0A8G2C2S9_DESNO|nr:OmpP1/FadL family transporter [Desulfomicrobium norvegicum]SFL62199.1 long-chain fatty acid transport protein [Desulfomicrobium norvegicum]